MAFLSAISLLAFALGWLVYARLQARLRASGGSVRTQGLDLPELLVAFVLATFFSGMVAYSALRRAGVPEDMSAEQVLPSALTFVIFVIGICGFLAMRRFNLVELFGLARQNAGQVLGWAALLLLAAFPFVAAANMLSVSVLGNAAAEQALVRLFRTAAQRGDYSLVAKIVVAGVVVAPLCEEFLFRGFFYPVAKRYAGAWISGLATALLFAAFHANLTSLPGLFVLAVAFTLAYERTGSLLVPITMHAMFNATSLTILYLQSMLPATA